MAETTEKKDPQLNECIARTLSYTKNGQKIKETTVYRVISIDDDRYDLEEVNNTANKSFVTKTAFLGKFDGWNNIDCNFTSQGGRRKKSRRNKQKKRKTRRH